jgi:hypothetical protein
MEIKMKIKAIIFGATGMSEEQYHLVTHDYVVKAAEVLSRLNPDMTFCFISGAGTDDTLYSLGSCIAAMC